MGRVNCSISLVRIKRCVKKYGFLFMVCRMEGNNRDY